MSDYVIWVSYHKDEQIAQYNLKEDDHHRLFATHKHAEGVNINTMNPVYSELVTMWYVWKNKIRTDYVGFEHYRRHLHVAKMPEKGECQIYRTADFGNSTIYEQYARCHNGKDMDLLLSILDEKYGKYNEISKHIRESHTLIANCTFLMKWADFTRMCRFLFPALEEYCQRVGITGNDEEALEKWTEKARKDFGGINTEYQRRVVSFLAERLISAWICNHLKYTIGIDVVIVHYNTPRLTEAAVRSLNKTTPGCRIWLFDNSDKYPFETRFDNLTYIDNTKGQLIDFDEMLSHYPQKKSEDVYKSNYGSAKHCKSVDYMMDMLPDGFILMDSDVLLLNNISSFVDRSVAVTGVEFDKHRVPLFQPFLCWLNVKMLKGKGIGYFNGDKMWALSQKEPNCWYDTGAWLHEQVMSKKLPWKHKDIWRYILHYGHGSWRNREDKTQMWLERNRALWV